VTEGGPPLGADDGFLYPVDHDRIEPGEVLLLYTDGVTEAENADHALYGHNRLAEARQRHRRTFPHYLLISIPLYRVVFGDIASCQPVRKGDEEVIPFGITAICYRQCRDGDEPGHPLRYTATVQHLDHKPYSPGSCPLRVSDSGAEAIRGMVN
jgi:hypothetical protein